MRISAWAPAVLAAAVFTGPAPAAAQEPPPPNEVYRTFDYPEGSGNINPHVSEGLEEEKYEGYAREVEAEPGQEQEAVNPFQRASQPPPVSRPMPQQISTEEFEIRQRGESMDNFLAVGGGMFALIIFSLLMFAASRYKRCPSNKILAVYGKVSGGKSVKCFHGGGAFVIPLIQDYQFLDLTPMTINIPLKGALSLQNIRVNVPSTFTIAIDTHPEAMSNAAVRLLALSRKEIEDMAAEIIFGQLRLTVASLTIEQINQDREKFLESIRKNIDTELQKIGLALINVNITDLTDDSGYIESIGKKAAATAVNQAKVDVAEQEKIGAVGEASAQREQRVQVSKFNAEAVEGENKAKAEIAKFNADLAEKEAVARQRSEVTRQTAEAEIQKSKAVTEQRRLEADEVVPKQISKQKVEIEAEAAAEKERREARGKADAILAVKTAEAEGIQKVLGAKAGGYESLVGAAQGNPRDAATLLMVEKLEEIVRLQTEIIKNIKIDKITVWDSGGNGNGSSTSNFMSNMIKALPPMHEVAKLAGMELPEYLGQVSGPQAPPENGKQPPPEPGHPSAG